MDRVAQLLSTSKRTSRILEIGPSHAPIAPKSAGWNTSVIDYTDREQLRAKFAKSDVDIDAIEEVDFIWTSGPLHTAVPPALHGTFDTLIASHVIEHVPDLAQFFISAAVLLKPDGVVSLAVPDKRYTFDCFKPVTLTGDVLAAHRIRASRHPLRTAFNHSAYSAVASGGGVVDTIAWGQFPVSDFKLIRGLDHALETMMNFRDDPDAPYVDYHAWQLTPASFSLIVLELGELGGIDWCLPEMPQTAGCEFIVAMRRGRQTFADADAMNARRVELLRMILMEGREQTDFMLQPAAPEAVLAAVPAPVPTGVPAGVPVAAGDADVGYAIATLSAAVADINRRMVAQQVQLAEAARVTTRIRTALLPLRGVWRAVRSVRRGARNT